MITSQLLHPMSIVVVGASNNVHKPGGAILKNLISGGYTGELRAVNPKEQEVQGIRAYADVKDIPDTDLAVLAKGQAPKQVAKENQQYRLCLQYEYIGSSEQGRKLLKQDVEEMSRRLPMGLSLIHI